MAAVAATALNPNISGLNKICCSYEHAYKDSNNSGLQNFAEIEKLGRFLIRKNTVFVSRN